jgi:hypothetical protein
MSDYLLNKQVRLATEERISRYTVGIAVKENQGIGTGTLITYNNGQHLILTATHVIEDCDPHTFRFWLRPGPMKEKPAAETTHRDIGGYTTGISLPVVEITKFNDLDIAIITLDSSYQLPTEADYYDIYKSIDFTNWQENRIDKLSLFVFGFPVGNSRIISFNETSALRFIGCASFASEYSTEYNNNKIRQLASAISNNNNFVFEYTGTESGISPDGFSGSGVWVLPYDPSKEIWSSDPLLLGVIHRYVKKFNIIAATKLSAFLASS